MRSIFLVALTTLLAGNCFSQTDSSSAETIFNKVERDSEYRYGKKGWMDYLKRNLKINTPERKGAPAGEYLVIVRFIVQKDGTLTDIVAETKHGYGMEQEVIRVIKESERWIPAQQEGKNVNAYRRQPVTFVVVEEERGRKKRG